MCWAILFVLSRSLVSFINGAAVAGSGFNPFPVQGAEGVWLLHCKAASALVALAARVPPAVPAAVLEGGVAASWGLREQRVPLGWLDTTPAPPRLLGQHREGGFAGGSRISAVTCC